MDGRKVKTSGRLEGQPDLLDDFTERVLKPQSWRWGEGQALSLKCAHWRRWEGTRKPISFYLHCGILRKNRHSRWCWDLSPLEPNFKTRTKYPDLRFLWRCSHLPCWMETRGLWGMLLSPLASISKPSLSLLPQLLLPQTTYNPLEFPLNALGSSHQAPPALLFLQPFEWLAPFRWKYHFSWLPHLENDFSVILRLSAQII